MFVCICKAMEDFMIAIRRDTPFAILIPLSLLNEIERVGKNEVNNHIREKRETISHEVGHLFITWPSLANQSPKLSPRNDDTFCFLH